MAKKSLASLMNGIMGEPNQEFVKSDNQLIEPATEPESSEVTEERKDNLETKRTLHKNLDSETFRNYYFLKEELVDFCRKNGLPTSGGKQEITERVAHFLDTGKVLGNGITQHRSTTISDITENSIIEQNIVCSEKHRAFFKKHIGKSFTFKVAFQRWLKENDGKTYRDAIEAYHSILKAKKQGKTEIDKQFEYNTYIRDFFAHNKGKTLEDAIKCWKYKKSLPGSNAYENSDLSILDRIPI